jgi:hypothetical protein
MARFNLFYYLFAALVVLVVATNALPASPQPDTGNVGAMPGMASELKTGNKDDSNAHANVIASNEGNYMDDMENALEAASKVNTQSDISFLTISPQINELTGCC